MKNRSYLLFTIFFSMFYIGVFAQTIEQQLFVFDNEQTIGGAFQVQLLVKGTNLPSANTLGSATLDIQFDETKLDFTGATNWAFSIADGYGTRSAIENSPGNIRVAILGTAVNANDDGTPAGFDIGSSYQVWVQLNFTILSIAGTTSLTINNITNQIGLYENHSNNPKSGVINDQTLSNPLNIIDAPLPIELITFTASANNSGVNLTWQTATEVDNYGFEIERRQSAESNWQKIGFVKGAGNSNSPKNYNFTDKNLTSGTVFKYRLKQIDTDGQFEYSDEIEVQISVDNYALLQNYPNPFNPVTNIKFEIPKEAKVTLNIYNILGENVARLINETLEAGFHSVLFDASRFPSGTYIYRLQAGNFVQTKKMILLK